MMASTYTYKEKTASIMQVAVLCKVIQLRLAFSIVINLSISSALAQTFSASNIPAEPSPWYHQVFFAVALFLAILLCIGFFKLFKAIMEADKD